MRKTQLAPVAQALFLCSLVLVLAGLACNKEGSGAPPAQATKPPGQPAGAGAEPPANPAPAVANSSPFLASDCACLTLPVSSSESNGDSLSCRYEWEVTVGDTHDTNQVQLYIDPWQSEEDALDRLAGEAQSLGSSGGEVSIEGGQDLYYVEKRGDAGFYYGELRVASLKGSTWARTCADTTPA
ncbi:MAG: hypothetical protein NTU91_06355 [Chloroflexi bacterium]|nr:hypothetical protein [Chloroflexota bacterium]